MKLIDSHAHLTSDDFNEDRSFLIKDLSNFAVNSVILPACDLENSYETVKLAEKYENLYAQVGFHPENIESFDDSSIEKLEDLAKKSKSCSNWRNWTWLLLARWQQGWAKRNFYQTIKPCKKIKASSRNSFQRFGWWLFGNFKRLSGFKSSNSLFFLLIYSSYGMYEKGILYFNRGSCNF